MPLGYDITTGKIKYLEKLDNKGGGDIKEISLLSITTAPIGEFAKGSKYYNLTDKKIYTAVVADSWDDATVEDPQFGTYYLYNNTTYIWDGDSLEKYNLEDFIPKTDIVDNLMTDDATKVLSAKQGKILNEKVKLKQDKTDNALTTTNKTIVGSINELNTEVNLKQDKTDNNLETEDKTVVGAINEVNQSMIGIPDLIIAENKILNKPLFYNGKIIINNGVSITVNEPLTSLIIKCKELINNGIIDVTGKGFQGKKVMYGEGVGYANGDNAETTGGSRAGGGAPTTDKPTAYRTMLGLASAVGGSYQAPYGPGYDGTNGGGGGGGSDGGPLSGGGSGAGGGGGGAGHGLTAYPKGGNGSQADITTNLQLFQNNQLEEIPLFGASGASGWQDGLATSKDTSNGGGNIQIYADKVENNGIIRANGETIYLTSPEKNGGCGGAGGGCIMIRTMNIINGTGSVIEAKGSVGHQYSSYYYGGNGGDGLILIDNNRTYLEQFKDMPEASSINFDKIVQYVGETDQFYTNGYFYKSVSDGQATPTYHWDIVESANKIRIIDINSLSQLDSLLTSTQSKLCINITAEFSNDYNPEFTFKEGLAVMMIQTPQKATIVGADFSAYYTDGNWVGTNTNIEEITFGTVSGGFDSYLRLNDLQLNSIDGIIHLFQDEELFIDLGTNWETNFNQSFYIYCQPFGFIVNNQATKRYYVINNRAGRFRLACKTDANFDEVKFYKRKNINFIKTELRNDISFNAQTILFYGDSIAAGYTNSTPAKVDNPYPNIFLNTVNAVDAENSNKSISGSSYTTITSRTKLLDTIRGNDPDNPADITSTHIFIAGGINDFAEQIDPNVFRDAVRETFDYIHEHNLRASVFIISPLNINTANSTWQKSYKVDVYRNILEQESYRYGFYYINGAEFPLPIQSSYLYTDNLHINQTAHNIVGLQLLYKLTKDIAYNNDILFLHNNDEFSFRFTGKTTTDGKLIYKYTLNPQNKSITNIINILQFVGMQVSKIYMLRAYGYAGDASYRVPLGWISNANVDYYFSAHLGVNGDISYHLPTANYTNFEITFEFWME